MIKFLWLLVLAGIACRLLTGKWPWTFFAARQTRQERLASARRLLGVPAGAGRKEIQDAHRRLLAAVHPDRGGSSDRVHEANAARDLLLDVLPPES